MRSAWKFVGGERGQVGHKGDPHVFVRAGEQTVMIPEDALGNLDPAEAAAIRRRAMAARRSAAGPSKRGDPKATVVTDPKEVAGGAAPEEARPRPWWKFW